MVGVNFITATPNNHGGLRDLETGDCRRKILMIVAWLEKEKGV